MVRIRLRRIGLKGQPTYRIVAAEKEAPRDGRFLEILGVYNPRTNPATIKVKEDRVYHWMKNGAQPSESVVQIFKSAGTLDRFDRFKKGEAVETLVAEAEAAEIKRAAPVKTNSN
jgi:small subunit ribosomal protein S16